MNLEQQREALAEIGDLVDDLYWNAHKLVRLDLRAISGPLADASETIGFLILERDAMKLREQEADNA